jgi:hypothetical protein
VEIRNACKNLMGKPEADRLLGGPRNKWQGDIKMDTGKI